MSRRIRTAEPLPYHDVRERIARAIEREAAEIVAHYKVDIDLDGIWQARQEALERAAAIVRESAL